MKILRWVLKKSSPNASFSVSGAKLVFLKIREERNGEIGIEDDLFAGGKKNFQSFLT